MRAAKRLALFLDFDGTLVSLRARPEDVSLSDSTRGLLRRLARHRHVTLWVISGRRRAEVRKLVKVPGVRYLGLHGWEGRDSPPCTKAALSLLRRVRKLLAERLNKRTGIWIQDKGPVIAVHYRGARGSTARRARALIEDILEPFRPDLLLLEGKKVWEILPREVGGKGAAVRALLKNARGSPLPIYVGDDTTDESAFAVLSGGLTVRVGARRGTRARFELNNPREVRSFLERVEAELA